MRVAMLLSNAFRPDPRVLKEAKSLIRAGYDVSVVCWDRHGEFPVYEKIEGIHIHRLSVLSNYSAGSRQIFYLPKFYFLALKKLLHLKPNIIHCHDLDTTLVGFFYRIFNKVPFIFDAHECYPEQIKQQVNPIIYHLLIFLERLMASCSDAVITVGQLLARRLSKLGGKKIHVVGNYQSLNVHKYGSNVSRKNMGLAKDDFVVSYIGGFTLNREIIPLIKASKFLKNIKILIAGDGIQRANIEKEISKHPNINYLGWIPQNLIADYTVLSDVIYYALNPNDGNSQYSAPNALFNAMACAKAVLTNNVGEIARIVQQEKCGIVIDQISPYFIAQALSELYHDGVYKKFGVNAFRAGKNKYNWSEAEKKLLEAYRKFL